MPMATARTTRSVLPGFGLTMGYTRVVPEPDRADSAGGAGAQERQRWAGTDSGRRRGTRAWSPRTS